MIDSLIGVSTLYKNKVVALFMKIAIFSSPTPKKKKVYVYVEGEIKNYGK